MPQTGPTATLKGLKEAVWGPKWATSQNGIFAWYPPCQAGEAHWVLTMERLGNARSNIGPMWGPLGPAGAILGGQMAADVRWHEARGRHSAGRMVLHRGCNEIGCLGWMRVWRAASRRLQPKMQARPHTLKQ